MTEGQSENLNHILFTVSTLELDGTSRRENNNLKLCSRGKTYGRSTFFNSKGIYDGFSERQKSTRTLQLNSGCGTVKERSYLFTISRSQWVEVTKIQVKENINGL